MSEYLKAYERAARIYCQKVGVDPDDKIPSPHPDLPGMVQYTPRWQFAAGEMIELSCKMTAMKQAAAEAAMETPPPMYAEPAGVSQKEPTKLILVPGDGKQKH